MTDQNQQVQVAAVLVAADLFSGLQQYLFARPYNEVANLIQGMGASAALVQEQVEHLNTFGRPVEDEAEVDEPKEKKPAKPKK